jgi:hypothetical protein
MSRAVHPEHQSPAAGGPAPAVDRQFFKLDCTFHVGADATPGDLAADAHALLSSAVGVMSLMDLTTDAEFALLHLLGQANGLLSLAVIAHEKQLFAAPSKEGAA